MSKVGDRVGAIMSATNAEVRLLGYGIYEGDHEIPLEGWEGITNPRIKLDNGEIVWGYQCWWGSEEKVKATIGSRKVIEVDIKDEPR